MGNRKILEIEWRHLDREGETCFRCSDTGEALQKVVAQLGEECRPRGWDIRFRETKLSRERISESNLILIDGKPMETVLPGAAAGLSLCSSCCDLTGISSTCCRTVEFKGQTYESIPVHLIRQAVCTIAKCCR
jgi:hypothetical protein